MVRPGLAAVAVRDEEVAVGDVEPLEAEDLAGHRVLAVGVAGGAARGTNGRIYPWGDTYDQSRANTHEGTRGTTAPVGSYPSGASPCGALKVALARSPFA